MKRATRIFMIIAGALGTFAITAPPSGAEILVRLEEPTTLKTYANVSNLRGWAIASSGIDRVEIHVDGEYAFDIPYGGIRADVQSAFPGFPDSGASGFSMAYNYKSLSPALHTMVARAYDNLGNFKDSVSVFNSRRFESPFISDPNQIDLTFLSEVGLYDPNTLILEGVRAEGKDWRIALRWDTATQSFEIRDLEPQPDPVTELADNPFLVGTQWYGHIGSRVTGCYGFFQLAVTNASGNDFSGIIAVTMGSDLSPQCVSTAPASFTGYYQDPLYFGDTGNYQLGMIEIDSDSLGLSMIGEVNETGESSLGVYGWAGASLDEGYWELEYDGEYTIVTTP